MAIGLLKITITHINGGLFIAFVCQKVVLLHCKVYVVVKCDGRTYFPSARLCCVILFEDVPVYP